MTMRVVVVEDDEATRRRWVRLLNESSGYRCAGEYSSAEMALRRLRPGQCEVALVDLQLPGMSGIDLIRALARKFPQIAPLVMTVNDDRSAVLEAIREGAAGYLLKRGDPKNLLIRLGELAANEFPLSPPIGQLIRDELRPRKTDGQIPHLTPAEEEVLRWLDQGLSNKEIALQRAVDEVTVRDQLSRIYGKLDVGNRVAALAKLRRLGWRPRQ
jgi:DNA-binding NarL/FixJ family response regulator